METDEQNNSNEGTLEVVEKEGTGGTKKYIITCTCTDFDGQQYSISKECTTNGGLCICSDPKHPQVMCELPWQIEDSSSETGDYAESSDSNAYGEEPLE